MDAILEATIQVLLSIGKDRLTTTRVADRAGVSVGTLYQYFPNKSALLQAVLRRHLESVTQELERACGDGAGKAPEEMAALVVSRFLRAKLRETKASVALYVISAELEGAKIAQELGVRGVQALARMLRSAPVAFQTDSDLMAQMMHSIMAGVSRRLVESEDPEANLEPLGRELTVIVAGYLESCRSRQPEVASNGIKSVGR